jgi:ribonuclease BN (tRNA processing enzyme)
MRVTIIGSGDAFGSGGRFHTCFHLATGDRTVLVDCGASTSVALRAHKVEPGTIDAIILSHLHGDHFGGIPLFLIDAQYNTRRERPLVIAGPPGSRARIDTALDAFFPGSRESSWRFPWTVVEIPVGVATDVLGLSVVSAEVIHFSGAPSTALRLTDGAKVFAYSGDTQWTDALLPIAQGADLFLCECFDYDRDLSGHLNWMTLRGRIADFAARRVMLTHMNLTMLTRLEEVGKSGVLIAEDGLIIDL